MRNRDGTRTAEDGFADTIRTRADAAGADVKKIYVLKSVHDEEGRATTFDLQQDLVWLAEKISEIGDVRLIVVDPITAYMGAGKIDTHKTADVRAVLSLLTEFSDKHGVAVIGLTHPSKSVTRAMNAATGRMIRALLPGSRQIRVACLWRLSGPVFAGKLLGMEWGRRPGPLF
jgi:RecA-family ATPase